MAYASDTEHRRHIDDANTAHLHVVAGDFRARAHDLAPIHQGNFGDIIGNQTVATLDQRQNTLALTDPALASQNHTDTQNIYHAPHLRSARGKHHFQRESRQVDEFHRDQG